MGIINGELIRKNSIIKGEVLDNNGTKCGQTSNVNYEVLKFDINNKLGASLDVVIDEEAKKSMLHLLSKQGQLLSEVELKYFETSRLNRVYLDLDRKLLVFTFNDGTSLTCDIAPMLDTLYGLIDQERQERVEGYQYLSQELATEITRATAKETELDSKIETEIQRATARDDALEQEIEEAKGEAKNYTYSKSEIDSKDASTLSNSKAYTDVETTARSNADTEIYNYIESIRFIETEVDW